MNTFYSNERNIQMVVSLLKAHNIRKVIASPGTTNVTFVASLQCDPFFEIHSCVDERSAAYMACGIAAESGEPVVLSCTGATASRNYLPGLTEAYYRKLPVLAVTSTQHTGRIGNLVAQVIDRSSPLPDTVVFSADIPTVHDDEDEWACAVAINRALMVLRGRSPGPAHLNLVTTYSKDFSVKELPPVQVIRRIGEETPMPKLSQGRIGIFVGAHAKWPDRLRDAVDEFCEKYDAVVFFDHTSNYQGKYGCLFNLVADQEEYLSTNSSMSLLIHIGEVSGAYMGLRPAQVWRVSPDGAARDLFRKLSYVFDMPEQRFFDRCNAMRERKTDCAYFNACRRERNELAAKIPNLPFSNAWIASVLCDKLPENSTVHLGILNSLRCWNFFETPVSVLCYSNTGGFGIDGCSSALLGASMASPDKLFFGFIGDLALFYDLNSLGNRSVGNNLRLLVVNNGLGTEFKNYNHPAARFGADADLYMAAGGHFGQQSRRLLKNYTETLGFRYLSASDKDEFMKALPVFVNPVIGDRPVFFEVFTDSQQESEALRSLRHLKSSASLFAKNAVKGVLGESGVAVVKKMLKR